MALSRIDISTFQTVSTVNLTIRMSIKQVIHTQKRLVCKDTFSGIL